MKSLLTLLISCSLIVPLDFARADQSTAPGQQKKEAGDGSAKDYAPGQEHDSGAAPKDAAKGKAKAGSDKAKPGATEPAAGAPTPKPKAKTTKKGTAKKK